MINTYLERDDRKMENPYQKFDEEQDKRYEKLIRQKIQNIIELAGNESDDTIRI